MTPSNASVVICCYTERRWDELILSIDSVTGQSHAPKEVIVVVDYNDVLEARLQAADLGVRILANRYKKGLSGARNTGVEESAGDVVVFLDDDAWADAEWLGHILEAYSSDEVAGVGGSIAPIWPEDRPTFFPPEFDWVIGCSYAGMETREGRVRNLIGANMSFRREVFETVGDFHTGVGRTATTALGGEDTELCIRVLQNRPGSRFVVEDRARVHHHVSADRTEWRYFVRRCYAEGKSKAAVSRLRGSSDGLSAEREYTLKVVPAAFGRNLLRAITRLDAASLRRAGAIFIGVAAATVGYIAGKLGRTTAPTLQTAP